jgi:hypothetical protein
MKRNTLFFLSFFLFPFLGWGQGITCTSGNELKLGQSESSPNATCIPGVSGCKWQAFWFDSSGWIDTASYSIASTEFKIKHNPKNGSDVGALAYGIYTPPVHKREGFNPVTGTCVNTNFFDINRRIGTDQIGTSIFMPFHSVVNDDVIPVVVTIYRGTSKSLAKEEKVVVLSNDHDVLLGSGYDFKNPENLRQGRFAPVVFEQGENIKRVIFWLKADANGDADSSGFISCTVEVHTFNTTNAENFVNEANDWWLSNGIGNDKGGLAALFGSGGSISNPMLENEISPVVSTNYRKGGGRDPNGIIFSPAVVEPQKETAINATIGFTNDGTAMVDIIALTNSFTGKYGFQTQKYGGQSRECNSNLKFICPDDVTHPNPNAFILTGKSGLTGIGQASSLPLNEPTTFFANCEGNVMLKMKSLSTINVGDEIIGQTTIIMKKGSFSAAPYTSSKEIVKVRRHPLKRLGMFIGLKYFVNDNTTWDSAMLKQRDMGLALTGRFALSKMNNSWDNLAKNNKIGAKDLPNWWYQWELGYSAAPIPLNDAKKQQNIDITPIKIRYMQAKGGAAIGASLGYTSSLTFYESAKKISHTVDFSLDYGNLFGERGLSLGAGIKIRTLNLAANSYYFTQPYIYLHYALGRIRRVVW